MARRPNAAAQSAARRSLVDGDARAGTGSGGRPAADTADAESCQALSDTIYITAVNSGVECQPLDTSGLGLLAGYLDAVKLSGELTLGVQICFRAGGSLLFFDESSSRRPSRNFRPMASPAWSAAGSIAPARSC